MKDAIWNVLKALAKSPVLLFWAYFALFFGLASGIFLIGILIGLVQTVVGLFTGAVGLAAAAQTVFVLALWAIAVGIVLLGARSAWHMAQSLHERASGHMDDAREALVERAERAEAMEAQGGMLSMSATDDGGGSLTQVAESGLTVAVEGVALDFSQGDEDADGIAQEVTLGLEEEAEQEVV